MIFTNKELVFQAKLALANKKILNQHKEKVKHVEELFISNIKLQKSLQLNADKDLFISILAHDLRSPFNALLGISDLLLENINQYDIIKIEKFISLINKSAKNTYNLLEDILMWARAQSGNIPFEPQKINLLNICKDFLKIFHPIANAKNITINCNAIKDINIFADIR